MILERQKESVVLQDGEQTQESIGMSLDLDSAQILMQMLSKNLYSDSIGSTIRECASNALDSHRRAGTKDPIIVSIGHVTNGGYEFSVEDFGIGLDADDVKNIISKYGKSTKRDSANELGMMGLGFKAPLAYSSSFYFVARKNGVERKYMMYEGEDVNTIDLLYETPTKERNGVKVIVPIQMGDRYAFENKVKEQLAYFEDVYFNVNGIDNDFFIMRNEHFQFSQLASCRNLHICLDNVYYDLDFQKLGIGRIDVPVALRFGLSDGIFPTPNREAIRYTQEAKTTILNKIRDLANYFVEKYNETAKDMDDVSEIINFYSSGQRYVTFGTSRWELNNISTFATVQFVNPKYSKAPNLDFAKLSKHRDSFLDEYSRKFTLSNGRLYSERDNRWNGLNWYHYADLSKKIYVYSDKISGIKKDYLRHLHQRDWNIYVVKKERSKKLGKLKDVGSGHFDNYMNLLRLDKHPKSDWRTIIKEFQSVVDNVTSRFINLDELVVPQQFIDSRKKQNVSITNGASGPKARRVKLAGEVVGKIVSSLERWVDGKNSKLVSTPIQLADAHKQPFLTIYGGQQHAALMDKWFPVFNKNKVRMVVFSERELKALKDVKIRNWISMEEFLQGKHIVFRRAATAYLIRKLIDNYTHTFKARTSLAEVSTQLSNDLEMLNNYANTYRLEGDDALYSEIIEIATQNNLFDTSIYSTYVNTLSFLESNPYVNLFLRHTVSPYRNDVPVETMQLLIDLLKYHKQKVNWKNYKIVLNEDALEVPTEETVEELATL